MSGPSLSVIVPVYNESTTVEQGLGALCDFLAVVDLSEFEVIVIESGSTDGTGEILDGFATQRPKIRVIHEGRRNGFGSAVQVGYRTARMEWIWLVTPDLPFPLEALCTALPLLDQYDAILSYRINDDRSPYRRLQSSCFNTLVKVLFGLQVKCVNSAFKLVRRSVVQSVDFLSSGWTIDTELIWLLERTALRFTEIPVRLTDRVGGASKISPRTALSVLHEILALRFHRF
jgi:glycosyltransferase involved in cell wall biosynthesis